MPVLCTQFTIVDMRNVLAYVWLPGILKRRASEDDSLSIEVIDGSEHLHDVSAPPQQQPHGVDVAAVSEGMKKTLSFSEAVESRQISDDEHVIDDDDDMAQYFSSSAPSLDVAPLDDSEIGDTKLMPPAPPALHNHDLVLVTWVDGAATDTGARLV